MKTLVSGLLLAATICLLPAQDIELPVPHKTGGMPLMEALSKRSTSREFSSHELTTQQLADLLWAGFGINRPDGKRTAPSAHNRQELDLYVLLANGAFRYDPTKNVLVSIVAEDLRPLGAKADAAACLLFVADLAKRKEQGPAGREMAAIDSGFISQNIYLYCASEGLVTGYRASGFDGASLKEKLKFSPDQTVVAAQPVGHPKP